MHRCYSQTEQNLLKYEINDCDSVKPCASALFLNRSNSFPQSLKQLNRLCLFPPVNHRPIDCECRLSAGCQIYRVQSAETLINRHLSKSSSRNALILITSVERSSSSVALCRKQAITRISLMASQIPPTEESSADSLKQTQSRGFIKTEVDEKAVDIENGESFRDSSNEVTKIESVRLINAEEETEVEEDEEEGAAAAAAPTKMVSVNRMECSMKREKTHASKHHNKNQNQQEDGGLRSKPQLDKIFTRAERFGSSSSNLATDFSRALLHNLLQRGKEASLEFETSHAGTFSNTQVDEGVEQPTDASVEELATKIVQRINQVKESRCSYLHFSTIKSVFDKLIAASPNLSHHLQRLKDLYMQPSSDRAVPEDANLNNSLCHPDSIARLERLEVELKEQASLLYKLLAELESLKEQNHRLTENYNEGETLTEMKTYKNLLLGQDKSIENFPSKN